MAAEGRGTDMRQDAARTAHGSVHAAPETHAREPVSPRDVRPGLLARGTAALQLVLRFEAPAERVLRQFFRDHPDLGRRDRGFVAETIYACLRRLRWYRTLAGPDDVRRVFLVAAARLPPADRRELAPVLGDEERAWLAWLSSAVDYTAPLGVRAELPDWVVEMLRADMTDDQILAIGRGMQAPAALDLRVNTLRADRRRVLEALDASGIEAAPTPYSPLGVRLAAKPSLEQHPLYTGGAVEIQDEGSQLLGLLLAPRRRETVADFCAGAGGKTLLLGAQMRSEGRLYAFDVSAQRVRSLHRRLGRAGLTNVQPEVIAHESDPRLGRLAGKLDRVLVDAPCTGFGTLRRNPDLKWRQTQAELAALTERQAAIVAAASRLLKPGGRLVYATCSFLPAENDRIVDAFLARHRDFCELDAGRILAGQGIAIECGARMQLTPHRHGTDGFYAAVLERQPA